MKMLSRVSYFLVLLFLFASLSMAQEMKPEAAKLYNKGNELLKAGNYKGALENYDKALAIEKDYRTYYQRGVAFKGSGMIDSAKTSFEESAKMKPDFAAAYNALGGIAFLKGNYDDAVKNFEKVLSMAKNKKVQAKIKNNLALAYTKMGASEMADHNNEAAIKDLNKAVENSNYDAAYLALAKAYSDMGNWDKTLESAQNALKYKSSISSGGPYYYMGLAYKNKGDLAKAKEMFSKAKSDATYKKLVEYELSSLK